MKVALLQVVGFNPDGRSNRAAIGKHSLDEGAVVARVDLVLQDFLCWFTYLHTRLDQEMIAHSNFLS